MRISELARRTGCHLETIRYYERIALLPIPARSMAGYRDYTESDAERLGFIVRSRALGFHLDEIRSLLSLAGDSLQPCSEVDVIARAHLAQVEAKQRELASMAAELREMLRACQQGTRATCNILRNLASPSHQGRGARRS